MKPGRFILAAMLLAMLSPQLGKASFECALDFLRAQLLVDSMRSISHYPGENMGVTLAMTNLYLKTPELIPAASFATTPQEHPALAARMNQTHDIFGIRLFTSDYGPKPENAANSRRISQDYVGRHIDFFLKRSVTVLARILSLADKTDHESGNLSYLNTSSFISPERDPAYFSQLSDLQQKTENLRDPANHSEAAFRFRSIAASLDRAFASDEVTRASAAYRAVFQKNFPSPADKGTAQFEARSAFLNSLRQAFCDELVRFFPKEEALRITAEIVQLAAG